MGLYSILKRNSKLALRGSWGRAIIILLIVMGVSTLVTVITQTAISIFTVNPMLDNPVTGKSSTFMELAQDFRFSAAEWVILGVSSILSLLLVAPLSLGATRWYYSLVHGKSLPITEMFYYLETGKAYFRAVFYEINISVRSMIWMILFYISPSAVLGISIFFLSGSTELSRAGLMTATGGIFLSAALYILATIFYAACVCRYALTPYLIAEDAELTVRKAIKLSIKYTKGFRFSILWFGLSYIGWFLLMVFFFPVLYVVPYCSTGIAMYSRFIIEKNRNSISEATQEFSSGTGDLEAVVGEESETGIRD